MPNFFNIEWLNANAQRKYPLAVDATASDITGAFTLPTAALVGMNLPVPASLEIDPTRFYLSRVISFASGVTFEFSYDDGTASPPVVASTTVTRASHIENDQYSIVGRGDFVAIRGVLVVGDINSIDAAGLFVLARAGGKLDPHVVRPTLRGIGGLYVTSGGITYGPFYDDIELIFGSNLQPTITSSEAGTEIRIDGIEGAGLTAPCVCAGGQSLPAPIRTINGQPPLFNGDFTLLGVACVGIQASSGGGVQISNTCATPCCGCTELETITDELQRLLDQATLLGNSIAAVQAFTTAASTTMLGARLNDNPCITA